MISEITLKKEISHYYSDHRSHYIQLLYYLVIFSRYAKPLVIIFIWWMCKTCKCTESIWPNQRKTKQIDDKWNICLYLYKKKQCYEYKIKQ